VTTPGRNRALAVSIGLVLVAVLAAFVFVSPRDAATPTLPVPQSDVAAGQVGDPSGGRNVAAVPLPATQADPALARDLAALAAGRGADLPRPDPRSSWLPVTLVSVEAHGARIIFTHRIDINRDTYDGPNPPREIVPGFSVAQCAAFTCFPFTMAFDVIACHDLAVAELLDRGAQATFVYRDRNGRDIGSITVTGEACDRLAAL
jgi:hypothetical protein